MSLRQRFVRRLSGDGELPRFPFPWEVLIAIPILLGLISIAWSAR